MVEFEAAIDVQRSRYGRLERSAEVSGLSTFQRPPPNCCRRGGSVVPFALYSHLFRHWYIQRSCAQQVQGKGPS